MMIIAHSFYIQAGPTPVVGDHVSVDTGPAPGCVTDTE